MRTILEVLNLSTDYLKQKNMANPRRQSEEMLSAALGVKRLSLYLEYDRPLNDIEIEKCRNWLKRRGAGEPLQYIQGEVEFLDCSIKVNSDVLIPRQETEILVDRIVKVLSEQPLEGKVLWDICCGSGCIGIAIKKRLPALEITLSDLSTKALEVARDNAYANGVDVKFIEGDLLEPFKEKKADYIVCNPPYIAEDELQSLENEVRKYEPKMALIAGKTGIEFYQRLASGLPKVLKNHGKVWMEIGDCQGEAIKKEFQAPCWRHCSFECDWAGRERFFSLEIE